MTANEYRKMKCTQDKNHICDNIDMRKCKDCVAPMLCLCTRPEVQAMVEKLWESTNEPK